MGKLSSYEATITPMLNTWIRIMKQYGLSSTDNPYYGSPTVRESDNVECTKHNDANAKTLVGNVSGMSFINSR